MSKIIMVDTLKRHSILAEKSLFVSIEYYRNKLAIALSILNSWITMVHRAALCENYFETVHNCWNNLP